MNSKQKSIIIPTVEDATTTSSSNPKAGPSRTRHNQFVNKPMPSSSRLGNVAPTGSSNISGNINKLNNVRKLNSNIISNGSRNGTINSKQSLLKNNANLKGNMMTMHMQQMGNVISQQQQQLSTGPIINAPKSLTNLAQMTNINLTPPKRTSTTFNNRNLSIPNIDSSPNNNSNNISLSNFMFNNNRNNFNFETPLPQQRSAASNNRMNVSVSKKPIYDLSQISSVQLLNQTNLSMSTLNNPDKLYKNNSNIMGRGNHTNINNNMTYSNINQSRTNNNNISQFNSRPNADNRISSNNLVINPRRQNISMNSVVTPQQSNDIPVIPVTESTPLFGNFLNDLPEQNSKNNPNDIILPQSGLNLIDHNSSDVNGDINNISLIKLMAILSNPALTITPVGSSQDNNMNNSYDYPHYNDSHQQPTMSSKFESRPFSNRSSSNNSELIRSSFTNKSQHSNLVIQSNSNRIIADELPGVQDIERYHNNSSYPNYNEPKTIIDESGNNNFSNKYNNLSDVIMINSDDNHCFSITNEPKTSFSRDQRINNSSMFNKSINKNDINSQVKNNNDKINDPALLSTSVRNLMMQQLPSTSKEQPAVSVQLLKHIANHSNDGDWPTSKNSTDNNNHEIHAESETDCTISTTLGLPRNILNLKEGVMIDVADKIITSCPITKQRVKLLKSNSVNRIYQRSNDAYKRLTSKKKVTDITNINLRPIFIEDGEKRKVFLSEKHSILDSIMKRNNDKPQQNTIPEPDDLFINRPKRIMSMIDTMVETKKRKTFEKISSQSDRKINSYDEHSDQSELEWSDYEDDYDKKIIVNQLPLDELETEDKKRYLLSVGLVSRQTKDNLLIKQLEKKISIISPLLLENHNIENLPNVQRFVDTIIQTGGEDVQLRIETNIKRNELPLIEGLNRNTSKLKMNFMNTLGLEKKSKRTTLYKVKPPESGIQNNSNSSSCSSSVNVVMNNDTKMHVNEAIDLIPVKNVNSNIMKKFDQPEKCNYSSIMGRKLSINHKKPIPEVVPEPIHRNCQLGSKSPCKSEYMKSLGLEEQTV